MSSPYRPPQRGRRPPVPQHPPKRGTAITSFVLGILGIPTFGLMFVGSLIGLAFGILALIRTNSDPRQYGGKGFAVAGIVLNGLAFLMVPAVGLIAAIAIPSLLRARVAANEAAANEAAAIGDVRTVISAQNAYASANAGGYDTLDCLAQPASCVPGYPASGPRFIEPDLATEQIADRGYVRTFHAGARLEEAPNRSPSALVEFAYVAEPEQIGVTGIRAFCGHPSGMICVFPDGRVPSEDFQGRCPIPCQQLE